MPDLREIEAGTTLVTAVAVADVLEEPQAGVPLVTQSLMGWPVQVLGVEGDWFHLQTQDGSPGWARIEHFCLPHRSFTHQNLLLNRAIVRLSPEPATFSQPICSLFLGSLLPLLAEEKTHWKVTLPLGATAYVAKEEALPWPGPEPSVLNVLSAAAMFSGAPYLWGGMTSRGVDCSGLTYMAYFLNHYPLPRNAEDQYRLGKPVKQDDLLPGDLVFFSTIDPGPSHVGLYQGEGQFLNARTKEGVTVTTFKDDFFASRYLGARRYL